MYFVYLSHDKVYSNENREFLLHMILVSLVQVPLNAFDNNSFDRKIN